MANVFRHTKDQRLARHVGGVGQYGNALRRRQNVKDCPAYLTECDGPKSLASPDGQVALKLVLFAAGHKNHALNEGELIGVAPFNGASETFELFGPFDNGSR